MSQKSLEPQLPREGQKQRSRDRIINLLLLGIIAANPPHKPGIKPRTRLARAREALFGDKNVRGQKTTRDDLLLFPLLVEALKTDREKMMRLLMSAQTLETRAEWQKELAAEGSSMRGIAKKHASDFTKTMTEKGSTEDWLRRAIKEVAVTSQDMADLEGLFFGTSPKAERLQRIFNDLKAFGIDCENSIGTKSADLSPKRD